MNDINILKAYMTDKLNEVKLSFVELRKVRFGDMSYIEI